ncbi:hypothetical protein EC501_06595 [Lysinibacillus halotolerans]|uniref:DUF4097 domain-containing protein n=1 Tax=Lysinibacillus halotolerans TaxID=1368476 RepID=A0A3M8HBL8_9BACI|nr:hypothetical protein EC501_06595 [Lysinibacillus halotolerans]
MKEEGKKNILNKKFAIGILLIAIVAVVLFNVFSNRNSEDEVKMSKDYTHVEVDSDNVHINIQPTNSDTTTVQLMNNEKNRYKLDVDVRGNTLKIDVDRKWYKKFFFNFFADTPTVNVLLPEKELKEINATTDNGDILVENVKVENFIGETDNGNIEAKKMEVEDFIGEADNGDMVLEEITSKVITTELNNGDIIIKNSIGTIEGESDNGDISIYTNVLEEAMELKTDNGSINIETKKEPSNLFIDVKTDHGKVSVFGKDNKETTFGNGNTVVELTSDNGDITVK